MLKEKNTNANEIFTKISNIIPFSILQQNIGNNEKRIKENYKR